MIRYLPFFLLLTALSCPISAQDSLFPDKGLEAAVRAQVFAKRNNQEPLTKEDVAKISTIKGRGRKIGNLSGVEHCLAVQDVQLDNNEIVDLTPLAGLKIIQLLSLKGNKIESIEPLKEFAKLQYLDLSGNKVKDISPLAKSTNMRFLELSDNAVEQLDVLKNFPKLQSLYLKGNTAKDWTPIGELKMLDRLDVSACKIEDLSFLKPLKRLNTVYLNDNQVKDLAPLVEMAGDQSPLLWTFYLKKNPVDAKSESASKLQSQGAKLIFE